MLEGVHELQGCWCSYDNARFSWLLVHSLGVELDSLCLSLSLLGIILSHSSLEGFSALALSDVLDSDVDSLRNDSASVLFVDDQPNSMLSHIENSSCFSMVEFVGHTLVDGAVSNDINVISLLVGCHDLGKMDWTVVSESLAEEVASSSSISVAVRHLY